MERRRLQARASEPPAGGLTVENQPMVTSIHGPSRATAEVVSTWSEPSSSGDAASQSATARAAPGVASTLPPEPSATADDVPVDPRLVARLRLAARVAGIAVALAGALVLLGWLLGVAAMTSLVPGLPTMKANTAVAFVLAGVALGLLHQPKQSPWSRRGLCFCTAGVSAIGAATLVEYATGVDLGIDQLLFLDSAASRWHGRMAPASAIGMALLGPALLGLSGRGVRSWLSQGLALSVVVLAGLTLLGYLYGARGLYVIGASSPIALPTALVFLAAAAAILASQPDQALMRVFTSATASGAAARRLLPAVLVVPVLLAWLRLAGQRAGLYGTEIGIGILTLGCISFFAAFTWWNARTATTAEIAAARLERSLVQNDQRARADASFRMLVERAPVGMIVLREGKVVYVNRVLLQILGYHDSAELQGRESLACLVHPDERAGAAGRQRAIVRDGHHPSTVMRFLRRDGGDALLETTGVAIDLAEGRSIVATVRDVTAQHAEEAARRRAEAKLVASLAEKETLLKEVHHRVKNNLQVVSSLIRLQSERIVDPAASAAFADLANRIHAIALIHERLYGSSDLGKIDMHAYLEGLVSNLVRANADDRRAIRVDVAAAGIFFDIDTAVPVGLIVNELITNAYKHAFPPGVRASGHIAIEITQDDTTVVVAVSDDGVGLPESFQLQGGDSLGMSLISGLSRQLDGKLVVERTAGSRFAVHFPISGETK